MLNTLFLFDPNSAEQHINIKQHYIQFSRLYLFSYIQRVCFLKIKIFKNLLMICLFFKICLFCYKGIIQNAKFTTYRITPNLRCFYAIFSKTLLGLFPWVQFNAWYIFAHFCIIRYH